MSEAEIKAQRRADKIGALGFVRDALRARLAVAKPDESKGLDVAVRLCEQQIRRFGG